MLNGALLARIVQSVVTVLAEVQHIGRRVDVIDATTFRDSVVGGLEVHVAKRYEHSEYLSLESQPESCVGLVITEQWSFFTRTMVQTSQLEFPHDFVRKTWW